MYFLKVLDQEKKKSNGEGGVCVCVCLWGDGREIYKRQTTGKLFITWYLDPNLRQISHHVFKNLESIMAHGLAFHRSMLSSLKSVGLSRTTNS